MRKIALSIDLNLILYFELRTVYSPAGTRERYILQRSMIIRDCI